MITQNCFTEEEFRHVVKNQVEHPVDKGATYPNYLFDDREQLKEFTDYLLYNQKSLDLHIANVYKMFFTNFLEDKESKN